MQSEFFDCSICITRFNSFDRLPKILPGCGHTICSSCLKQILQSQHANCPLDRKPLDRNLKSIDMIPNNLLILQMLDGKPQAKPSICSIHKAPKNFYCVDDKSEICEKCAIEKSHQGHSVHNISEVFSKAGTRKKNLKGLLDDFEGEVNAIYGLLEENKKNTLALMKDKFARIRAILTKKEQEMASDIEVFFTKEKSLIDHQVHQNDPLKEIIKTKIQNLSQFEINDKMLREVYAVTPVPQFSPISQYSVVFGHSKEIQQNIENSFNNLISLASSVIQEWKPLSEFSLQQEVNHVIGNEIKNEVLMNVVKKLRIEIEHGCLMIYPLEPYWNHQQIERNNILNLSKSRELSKVCLDFRKQKLSKEQMESIAEVCKGLKKITFVKLLLSNNEFTDKDLLDFCSENYWCSSQVEFLYIYLRGAKIGHAGISALSEMINGQNIKTFALDCSGSPLSDLGLKDFAKNLIGRLKNIEWFSLWISHTLVTDYGIGEFYRELYKVMPNIQNLSLALEFTKITQNSFEYFNKTLLPAGKNISQLSISCPPYGGSGMDFIKPVIEVAGSCLPKLKKFELEFNMMSKTPEFVKFLEEFKKNHSHIVTNF